MNYIYDVLYQSLVNNFIEQVGESKTGKVCIFEIASERTDSVSVFCSDASRYLISSLRVTLGSVN